MLAMHATKTAGLTGLMLAMHATKAGLAGLMLVMHATESAGLAGRG